MRHESLYSAVIGLLLVGSLDLWAVPRGAAGEIGSGAHSVIRLPEHGTVRADRPVSVKLPPLDARHAWAVTVRLSSPEELGESDRVAVRIRRDEETVTAKFLHNGDPDLCVLVRGQAGVRSMLEVGEKVGLPFEAVVRTFRIDPEAPVVVETEPNDRPEQATVFQLGQTVFASADDRPFIPAPGQDEADATAAGVDWFTFKLECDEPKLAYFWLDVLDREVPVDVGIYALCDGKPVPYDRKFERFEPERSTQFVGLYKFVARKLRPGRYYLCIQGNHPAYQLRSAVYPVPPYDPEEEGGLRAAAEKAIRAAIDYIILKGDSWHANTPRVGAVDNRVRNVHAETAQCIACHPTQFSTRGALFAFANGYAIRRRPQLEFLTERLYNNPRPFYGHPQAAWARMISASANTLSRPSVILDLFETHVSGQPRSNYHRDIAEYLKLYYKGRTELPRDESNGNRPLVSAFEVATHSWMVFDRLHRQTGDAEYARWRDHVRRLIEIAGPEHVEDMLDLCYQTIALCRMDREGYADRIRTNVERIFDYQRPDGQWPMQFGKDDPTAEFQTGHCLYTLAQGGVPAKDPRVARGIRYLLLRQHPFGAWYDDDDAERPHPYENFQTPFRETQFALMALSQYFPGPGGSGWHGGSSPPPDALDTADWQRMLGQIDAIWEPPGEQVLRQLTGALNHGHVLVRAAAAASLGRVGGQAAVAPLVAALGEGSKLVRRAAAWGLRQLGNRGLAKDEVADVLRGDNLLARRGAMQIFAQHFRYWIDRPDIGQILLSESMSDGDPFVRMMACRALWQWWYWDAAEEIRSAIEDSYLARMALEDHLWVRRNLAEAFYVVCDENVRYLYNNWIALLGTKADRDQAEVGHHANGKRQAEKIAAVLRCGSRRQVQTLLNAVGFFHMRGDRYGGRRGRFTRIGNDKETVQFYADAAPMLKLALAPYLSAAEPRLRASALLAGYTLRGAGDDFAMPYLRALAASEAVVRDTAAKFYDVFLPRGDPPTEPELIETVARLLSSDYTEAQAAAFHVIGRSKFAGEARRKLADSVASYLAQEQPPLLPQALEALAGLPELWQDVAVIQRVAGALRSQDVKERQAAVRLVLEADPLGAYYALRLRLDELFNSTDPAIRKSLLQLAGAEASVTKHVRVASLVTEALNDRGLRQMALDLVRRSPELQSNAAVRVRLARLLEDPNERTRQIAASIYSGNGLPRTDIDVARLLDYQYFKEKVQPIFFTKAADRRACLDCHHNHGILKLTGQESGAATEEASKHNYLSALRVVNLAQPEKSLLLLKPLSTADTEGVVGARQVSHGGERRWPDGTAGGAYQAILAWINGARLDHEVGKEE